MKSEEQKKLEKENKVVIEPVRPIVPLQSCFTQVFAEEAIEDWYSPAIKQKSVCLKDKRFVSFPKYLILQMGRFTYEASGSKKIGIFIFSYSILFLHCIFFSSSLLLFFSAS